MSKKVSKPKTLRWFAGGIIEFVVQTDAGTAQICMPERWRVKALGFSEAAEKIARLAYLNEKRMCHVWVMPVAGNDDPSVAVCSGKPTAGIEGSDKN